VRRLRELGLPLDRIAQLLDGTEPALHEALDALDAELAAQAERIAVQREQLARLRAASPDPELPEPLAALFAGAVAAGVPARAVAQDREFLLIDLALHPERTDAIVAEYLQTHERMAQQPGHAELVRRFDALADVDADVDADVEDAAVEALAADMAALIRVEHAAGTGLTRRTWNPLAEAVMADWGEAMPRSQRRVMQRAIELTADLF